MAAIDTVDLAAHSLIDEKYRVIRDLGQGAVGRVVLAHDLRLEREVAIKILKPQPGHEEELRRRFHDEALVLAKLRHNNVAQIYDFGEAEGRPYIVMEFVPGRTVAELLQNESPLAIDVTLGILRQVSSGLDAVHRNGFVHRDVKPGNIIIAPGYRIVLVDFGLVEIAPQRSEEHVAGTPEYLAPELITQSDVDHRLRPACDIYALGICAYLLLSEELPFQASTPSEVLRLQVQEPLPDLCSVRADLPFAFDDAIRRATSKDPAQRFSSAGAFLQALEAARPDYGFDASDSNPRILVIDRSASVRNTYRIAFEAAVPDVEILEADDGVVALEIAQKARPQLIVVDADIERLGGLEFFLNLANAGVLELTNMVAVSTDLDAKTEAFLKKHGASEILNKPLSPKKLGALGRQYALPRKV